MPSARSWRFARSPAPPQAAHEPVRAPRRATHDAGEPERVEVDETEERIDGGERLEGLHVDAHDAIERHACAATKRGERLSAGRGPAVRASPAHDARAAPRACARRFAPRAR